MPSQTVFNWLYLVLWIGALNNSRLINPCALRGHIELQIHLQQFVCQETTIGREGIRYEHEINGAKLRASELPFEILLQLTRFNKSDANHRNRRWECDKAKASPPSNCLARSSLIELVAQKCLIMMPPPLLWYSPLRKDGEEVAGILIKLPTHHIRE